MSKKKIISDYIPDIDKYWDYEKNEGLAPDDIPASSSKKVWTKCPECGNSVLRTMRYSWEETSDGHGRIIKCRTCGKRNDSNSLVSCCPEVLNYWDHGKNTQKPEFYTISSGKSVYMNCPVCSKSLYRPVCDSINKDDNGNYYVAVCLECSLTADYRRTKENRANTLDKCCPDIEKYWDYEHNSYRPEDLTVYANEQIHIKCPSCGEMIHRLCQNSFRQAGDKYSIIPCIKCGIKSHVKMKAKQRPISAEYPDILKWWDNANNELSCDEVSHRSKYLASFICPECHESFKRRLREFITVHSDGSYLPVGCPFCGYTPRDYPEDNLIKVCPDITDWWNYEKNHPHIPEEYTAGSQQQAYLTCPDCGLELYTGIHSLVETLDDGTVSIRHRGKCRKYRSMESDNNIVANYPDIKLWWDYEKNYPNKPEEYTLFSPLSAHFKCPDCGGETYRRITDAFALNKDNNPTIFSCPFCSNVKVLPGFNDLQTTDPELAKEYSPNNERSVSAVRKNLQHPALWICPTCSGEYLYIINNRQLGDHVCPYCNNTKLLEGFNSFGDKHPELLSELYELGNAAMGRSPFKMLSNSSTKLWWECPKDEQHKYLMSPKIRLMFQKRDREPCLYCRGLRRKMNHFINYYGQKKMQNPDT